MISHCANRACALPFPYLSGARLYRFELGGRVRAWRQMNAVGTRGSETGPGSGDRGR
jgi:hypothetical protein